MSTATADRGRPLRRPPPRRGGHGPLVLPLMVFAAVAFIAFLYIGYVLWPRWPLAPVGLDAPALPVTVAGVAFNVRPAAIRVGMQRRGFSREDIQGLRNAYQFLFSPAGTLSDRINETAERFQGIAPVDDIIDFIRADSSRAICQPKGTNDG